MPPHSQQKIDGDTTAFGQVQSQVLTKQYDLNTGSISHSIKKRTLKGRDLSKVRNAVLTRTGFLESP